MEPDQFEDVSQFVRQCMILAAKVRNLEQVQKQKIKITENILA